VLFAVVSAEVFFFVVVLFFFIVEVFFFLVGEAFLDFERAWA
jgi:hypothetical protein